MKEVQVKVLRFSGLASPENLALVLHAIAFSEDPSIVAQLPVMAIAHFAWFHIARYAWLFVVTLEFVTIFVLHRLSRLQTPCLTTLSQYNGWQA